MLNIKNIERSLAKYAGTEDALLADKLKVFGALIKRAAEISARSQTVMPQWTHEDFEAAQRGTITLLKKSPVRLDPKAFYEALTELAAVFVEASALNDEGRALCACVDWQALAAPELVALAASDPYAYLERIESLVENKDVLEIFVLPVAGFAIRAFLDPVASEAGREIDALQPDTVHTERALKCPVCGGPAAIAAVVGTMRNGNVKKLYCTCCGASWKFERIRCAVCGDEAVSDLSYVHDEKDESHRLHVCKSCGAAMPTVFAGEELNFNADVEGIVMSGLENFYEEEKAGKTQSA